MISPPNLEVVQKDELLLQHLTLISDRLLVLEQKIDHNRKDWEDCLNTIRQEVKPISIFYTKINTLGSVGRLSLYLFGAILAMAAATASIIKFIRDIL